MVHGNCMDLAPTHERVFIFSRTLGKNRLLTAINFSPVPKQVALPEEVATWGFLLSNDPQRTSSTLQGELGLSPREAVVLKANMGS